MVRWRLKSLSRPQKVTWIAALGAALGLIIVSFQLPGGDDLYRYYLPFVSGCLKCGYVPYYAQWFLAPLRLLPAYPLSWPFWTVICITGFLILAHITNVNPFWLMISFPMLGQVWLGQVDVLIGVGLVMFLFAKTPYLRGAGFILALTKPQLTALPILICLLLDSPSLWLKLFLVPGSVLLTSIIVFGWNWPISWFTNVATSLPIHVWRLASLDVWRFGIFLLPLPLLFREKRERLIAGLLVSSLATPFYGVYSYVLFLLFDVRWWSVLFSYIWLGGFVFWQEQSMQLAWILPVSMLAYMTWLKWKTWRR